MTNNSFLEQVAFDGMRKELLKDFDDIWILDLGGNVRKNPKLSGTTHNVFGIQVGVSINLLVRRTDRAPQAAIRYSSVGEDWRKEQKYKFLEETGSVSGATWERLTPDENGNWITRDLRAEFSGFLPLGIKVDKADEDVSAVFRNFSIGANTARDSWVYNFQKDELADNVQRTIEAYSIELSRWQRKTSRTSVDRFISKDDRKIKWSSKLKEFLVSGTEARFAPKNIRHAVYRPFSREFTYFDSFLTHRRGRLQFFLPSENTEAENRLFWIKVGAIGPPLLYSSTAFRISCHKRAPNASPSTPTPKTAPTAARTSPTGPSNNSAPATTTPPSPNGTSSTTSTPSCTTPNTAPATPPTSAANYPASRSSAPQGLKPKSMATLTRR